MKRIHLLTVSATADEFAPLAQAIASRSERLGWLEWQPHQARPALPDNLAAAAGLPVLRAVSVNAEGSMAVKAVAGPPVLRDVLRENFRGCLAVLVLGEIDAPSLRAVESGFEVRVGDESRVFSAEQLADRLRRPRPFSIE